MHRGVTFLCSKCDYKFIKKGSLIEHIKSMNRAAIFPSPNNLIYKGETFPCPDCDHKTSRKDHLQRHNQSTQYIHANCITQISITPVSRL